MPESWYLMSQPLFNSGFEGDEFSAFAQGGFEEILASPLADDIEVYEKNLSAAAVKTRAIIQGVTADNYNNSVLRQFLCRIGSIRLSLIQLCADVRHTTRKSYYQSR